MLGTISLIALVILGFLQILPWVVLPIGAILNTFLGLHFPPGKAQRLLAEGLYWKLYVTSLPIQAVFAAIVYGLGYGIGILVS